MQIFFLVGMFGCGMVPAAPFFLAAIREGDLVRSGSPESKGVHFYAGVTRVIGENNSLKMQEKKDRDFLWAEIEIIQSKKPGKGSWVQLGSSGSRCGVVVDKWR